MENQELDLKEQNEGSIIIQGNQYKLDINGITIYNDGTTQWTYMEDAEEVNISDANSEEEGIINPATIFTIYEKGFTNTFLGEFTSNSKKSFKIELVPLKIQEFERVVLTINQSTYQIIEAQMFGNDENQYKLIINNMNTEKSYPASTFHFEATSSPGVSVIDMR
jgi:outer membrane lipoprotein-sorting protein